MHAWLQVVPAMSSLSTFFIYCKVLLRNCVSLCTTLYNAVSYRMSYRRPVDGRIPTQGMQFALRICDFLLVQLTPRRAASHCTEGKTWVLGGWFIAACAWRWLVPPRANNVRKKVSRLEIDDMHDANCQMTCRTANSPPSSPLPASTAGAGSIVRRMTTSWYRG